MNAELSFPELVASLLYERRSTVRVLALIATAQLAEGGPITTTYSELADAARAQGRPLSRKSASRGVKRLVTIGLLLLEPVTGHAVRLELVGPC